MKWICLIVITICTHAICSAQSEIKKDDLPSLPQDTRRNSGLPKPAPESKTDPAALGKTIILNALIIQIGDDDHDFGNETAIDHEIRKLVQELKSLATLQMQEATEDKDIALGNHDASRLSELIRSRSRITVLSRPQIAATPNSPAVVSIWKETTLPYMEKVDEGTFKLRYTPPQKLGIDLALTVSELQRKDGDKQSPRIISLSPVELAVTAIDGRATIEGVELPIGKPIITRRTVETSIELVEGDMGVIRLPVADGKHVFMIVSAKLPK